MRRCTLAFALAPILVVLCSAHAAAAAPASKKVARRGPARPAVAALPAPLAEPLPSLPATTYEKSQVTTLTNAEVPAAAPTAAPPVASVQAAPAPASSPPERDRAHGEPASAASKPKAPKGWVLQLGTGVLVPTTAFVKGAETLGPGVSFDLRLGVYVTPHIGILGGFRGSYAHRPGGCSERCVGYSLQVPLLLQLAVKDRIEGLYGEVGLGLATTYGASNDGSSLTVSAPLTGKMGLGYRINPQRTGMSGDLNLGMDVGTMDNAEVSWGSYSNSLSTADAPTYVVVALSGIMHFSL